VSNVQEAGWVPGLVWTGAENLASTGIRSPDLPACSKSLYHLQYPDYPVVIVLVFWRGKVPKWRGQSLLNVTVNYSVT
jgi:hypothetical protein